MFSRSVTALRNKNKNKNKTPEKANYEELRLAIAP